MDWANIGKAIGAWHDSLHGGRSTVELRSELDGPGVASFTWELNVARGAVAFQRHIVSLEVLSVLREPDIWGRMLAGNMRAGLRAQAKERVDG